MGAARMARDGGVRMTPSRARIVATAFAVVYFKARGEGASMMRMYAPEHEVLGFCRNLADFAGAEYISVGDWSWYGYDMHYYHREGIGCGRLGLPKD